LVAEAVNVGVAVQVEVRVEVLEGVGELVKVGETV
jgi:hypothetical protein